MIKIVKIIRGKELSLTSLSPLSSTLCNYKLFRLSISCLTSQVCAPLCLKDKGPKEEIIDRIIEFLLCPTAEVSTVAMVTFDALTFYRLLNPV